MKHLEELEKLKSAKFLGLLKKRSNRNGRLPFMTVNIAEICNVYGSFKYCIHPFFFSNFIT